MRVARLTWIAVVLLWAAAAVAQDFEIFDPSDFIDPRERGAIFDESGFKLISPGSPFSVIRFYGGRVHDYQQRDTPTTANVDFAHVTLNNYRGNHQYTLKLTGYHDDSAAHVPRYRGTFQFASYFALPVSGRSAGAGDQVRAAGRILFTGTLEENPLRNQQAPLVIMPAGEIFQLATTTAPRRRFDHEFGVEFDSYVEIGSHAATGAFVWSRHTVADGSYADRIFYFYRGPQTTLWSPNVRFTTDLGFGGQHTDRWHWGATRLIGIVSIELPEFASGHRSGAINVALGPTYIPGPANQRHTYREAAVYYHVTLAAHLGSLPEK